MHKVLTTRHKIRPERLFSKRRPFREPQRLAALMLLFFLGVCSWAETFFIDYSKKPDPAALMVHDLSIVHPEAALDLAPLHRAQRRVLAYLSVVEAAHDAPYLAKIRELGLKPVGTNALWRSALMDVSSPEWRRFVVEDLARDIFQRDFDGLFLDTADSVELLAKDFPDRAEAFRDGLVTLIRELRKQFPKKQIVMNRGLAVWERVRSEIQGVLIESMYQTFDLKERRYHAIPLDDTAWLKTAASKIKSAGLQVYVVDYVEPRDRALAFSTATRIEADGFQALITTPDLQGEVLAPLRRMPRRILVLYGNESKDPANMVNWPSESSFVHSAQTIVEWLGYEVDYRHVVKDPLPETLSRDYAAVVVDRFASFQPSQEGEKAQWLIRHKEAGFKVILLGDIPFDNPAVVPVFLKGFGFRSGANERRVASGCEIVATNGAMHFEMEVPLKPTEHLDLKAPEGSNLYFSVAEPGAPDSRFDAVFTTSWGGVALNPYYVFTRPDYMEYWLVDPLAFFREALGCDPGLPVPDTTTLDGTRILFTHIDGDGFRHKSTVEAGKISAEIVLERILVKYPFPHTVSVIEAEIRGLVADQKDGESEYLANVARKMFALPFVEAGSHAYSHPFYWIEGDLTAKLYKAQALTLKPGFARKGIDLQREIEGSIRFIEKELLPPGKRVEMFQWCGNCKPPPEALKIARLMGVQCINGGQTTISRKYPSLTCVGPRGIQVGDEFQVYAANDNENVYQQGNLVVRGAGGAFLGGFMHLIEAFERTESPRRLKPVNIYYHFYSADTLAALRALERNFDWAMKQELRPVTTSQFVRIVHDARGTGAFIDREGAVWFGNQGELRTFRIDRTNTFPDLESSRGLLGFRSHNASTYLHADGAGLVRVKTGTTPPVKIHLTHATSGIRFQEKSANVWRFSVADRRPVTVGLGGLKPSAKVRVTSGSETSAFSPDATGNLILNLPAEASVQTESD